MRAVIQLAGLLLITVGAQGQVAQPQKHFPVYDAIGGFVQKPDLTPFGLEHLTLVPPTFMWEGNKIPDEISLPDSTRINAIARLATQTSNLLVVDIEQWPVTGDAATVAESVRKYRTVIQWFKAPAPDLKVGLYSVIPIRNYWDSIQDQNSARYRAWKKQDDSLASIAQLVDVIFPSLYTFYDDRIGWQKYAIAQIQEARRYAGGKPVYVFLWPQYEAPHKALANTFLPGDYWRLELETARKYADGVVIWCCSNSNKWNDSAPWWLETQGFMKEIGARQP